jgi:hypothetical protein
VAAAAGVRAVVSVLAVVVVRPMPVGVRVRGVFVCGHWGTVVLRSKLQSLQASCSDSLRSEVAAYRDWMSEGNFMTILRGRLAFFGMQGGFLNFLFLRVCKRTDLKRS